MGRSKAFGLAAMLLLGASGPGDAEEVSQQSFDLSLAGLRVATVSLSVREQGVRYAARGVLKGSGLLGSVLNLAFDGTVQGFAQSDGVYVPERYEALRGKGDKARRVTMAYGRGTPQSVTLAPPRKNKRPYDIEPTAQQRTLDPVTAAVTLLPDRPVEEACARTLDIFDGTRRQQITIGPRREVDGELRCAGSFERIAGYSPRSMREQTRFNFELRFRQVGERVQVTRIVMETEYGRAVARRR